MQRRPPTSYSSRAAERAPSSRSLGQALVETAFLLPILLILLVAAIDLGRAFFGWVNLHQAARVAANYAATHPDDDYSDADLAYYDLIENESSAINCELERDGSGNLPSPTFSAPDPELGDFATVELICGFDLITPIAAQIVGGTIDMVAESTFPVREGCIDCPAAATPPPGPEPQDPCRTVPPMAGLSLEGARNAWLAAGFLDENFIAPAEPGTSTVDDDPEPLVVEDVTDSGCEYPIRALYSSSVTLSVVEPELENPPTCYTVPNLKGLAVADARDAWTSANFTGEFLPPEPDDDPLAVVLDQTTDPASDPGVSCMPPGTTVEVQLGEPWPTPPPPPCIVPSFTEGVRKNDAQALWTQAHFLTDVELVGGQGNWLIKGQSLVGGEEYHCSVDITLYEVEPAP